MDMDYDYYRSLEPGDVIPIQNDLSKAIVTFAPHVAHVTEARVVSVRRAIVVAIQDKVVVKVNATLTEANNLDFVSKHTSVPVPKLFGRYIREPDGLSFVVMEFVSGQPATVAWPSLSHYQKQRITCQLSKCFEELRTRSADFIGSIGGGSLLCDYLDEEHPGPFRNEEELNKALVQSLPVTQHKNHYTPYILQMLKTGHKIVFSHGDLALRNLMIHEGALSAINDWEYAGFYPEYWEYAVAFDQYLWRKPAFVDWNEYVQKFLKPYPVEAAILRIVHRFSRLEI